MVILVGDYYRSISRRELLDINELHELSTALASIPTLPEQLRLILSTFARMYGADKGLICIHAAQHDALEVAAGVGFGPGTLETMRDRGLGASVLARTDRARIVIEDTERDARFASKKTVPGTVSG